MIMMLLVIKVSDYYRRVSNVYQIRNQQEDHYHHKRIQIIKGQVKLHYILIDHIDQRLQIGQQQIIV